MSSVPEFILKTDHSNVFGTAKNLEELVEKLKVCPPEVIKFHLREGKNDFAEWIEKAIGDRKLAAILRRIKLTDVEETRRKIIRAILKRLKKI